MTDAGSPPRPADAAASRARRLVLTGFCLWLAAVVALTLFNALHLAPHPTPVPAHDTGPVLEDVDFGAGLVTLTGGIAIVAVTAFLTAFTGLNRRHLTSFYKALGFFPALALGVVMVVARPR